MKVANLITELLKLPPDYEVMFAGPESNLHDPISDEDRLTEEVWCVERVERDYYVDGEEDLGHNRIPIIALRPAD